MERKGQASVRFIRKLWWSPSAVYRGGGAETLLKRLRVSKGGWRAS